MLEVSYTQGVSRTTTRNTYSIKDAASLTGLPASTLRYYESIGVIGPIGRGETSSHRVYSEADLDQLMWVACLSATGMSVSDMRTYVANGAVGAAAAPEQIRLLADQQHRLAVEAEQIELRQHYVRIGLRPVIRVGRHPAPPMLRFIALSLASSRASASPLLASASLWAVAIATRVAVS